MRGIEMTNLNALLGVAGTLAFAWACVPTAWRTFRAGRSIGTPVGLAWNIWIACLLFYGYLIAQYGFDPFLLACTIAEVLSYSVVIWLHYFPRTAAQAA